SSPKLPEASPGTSVTGSTGTSNDRTGSSSRSATPTPTPSRRTATANTSSGSGSAPSFRSSRTGGSLRTTVLPDRAASACGPTGQRSRRQKGAGMSTASAGEPERTVRAAVLETTGAEGPYEKTRPISVREVGLRAPGPGELLVRVRAAGLCHSDLSVVDGARPRPVPMVLGHEAAGEVAALGPGTDAR